MDIDPEMVTVEFAVADLMKVHKSLSASTSLNHAEQIDRILDAVEDGAES
jgi:hypothetical protein